MSTETSEIDVTDGSQAMAAAVQAGRRLGERFWATNHAYVVHLRTGEWLRGELDHVPDGDGWHFRLGSGDKRRIAPGSFRFIFRADARHLDANTVNIAFDARMRDGHALHGALHALLVGSEGVFVAGSIGDLEGRFLLAPEVVGALELNIPEAPVEKPEAEVPSAIDADAEAFCIASSKDLKAYLAAQTGPAAHQAHSASRIALHKWLAQAGDEEEGRLRFSQSLRFDIPLVDLDAVAVDGEATAAISPTLARRLHALPLALRDNAVVVAMLNPADPELITTLEFLARRRVVPLLAMHRALEAGISQHYDHVEDSAILRSLGLRENVVEGEGERGEMERLASEQPIVRLVSGLVSEAIHRRASDIHVRPHEHDVAVLFRIDGLLLPVRRLAKPLLRAVASRIKVMGGMDVAEHRLPQDGRATVVDGQDVIDLRISILPTVDGESVVVRLLNTRQGLRSLKELGLVERDERMMRDLMSRSHGLVLVTGPTGSGKSTTLYAALLELREHNVNIITVEDPVEYHIADIEQVQINAAIGYGFGRTLRNILRHDPDVIMIGEIRDHETAEIAVESALTGHIVLSTLHTNSAATTVTRMLDLGVESFLLRSTLLAVLAQRLARRNCRHCLVEENADPELREALGAGPEERFFRGSGCSRCDGTGVHGRHAVYELMPITQGIRTLMVANADGDAIHEQAVRDGMQPLTARALQLAREGVLSLAEVQRIRVE